jgi:hypothetical protein
LGRDEQDARSLIGALSSYRSFSSQSYSFDSSNIVELFIMGFLELSKSKTKEGITPNGPETPTAVDSEKVIGSQTASEKDHDDGSLSSNAQAGVKAVEAATSVWTKYHLIGAYLM